LIEMPLKELTPGAIFASSYRILHILDEGGMGAVYAVEQMRTGARRALKIMHHELVGDPRFRDRFAQESRIGASIKSDHVVQVLDAGVDKSTNIPFLVMDFLEGQSLTSALKERGAYSATEVGEIFRQLCHAIGAAHALGIVHRDLKPDNIFLAVPRTTGVAFSVKVLDFGIAKILADSQKSTGLLGTNLWMAPEQTQASTTIGSPTDVWALGLIAFLLLTGQHYWNDPEASTPVFMRQLLIDELVPASARARERGLAHLLPARFDEWFARCVNRDARYRFANAADAYAALEPLLPADRLGIPKVSIPRTEPGPRDFGSSPGQVTEPGSPSFGGSPVPRTVPGPGSSAERPDTGSSGPVSRQRSGAGAAPPPRDRLLLVIIGLGGAILVVLIGLLVILMRKDSASVITAATIDPASSGKSPLGVQIMLRLHGSNTVGAELAPALAEAFLSKREGASSTTRVAGKAEELVVQTRLSDQGIAQGIEIFAHGSGTAFEDLDAERCDIGMASRRITDAEGTKLSRLGTMTSLACEHVLALDGIAIIVHPNNQVSALTREQIADIFSGQMRSWTEVGSTSGSISIHARDEKSGTFDIFKHIVLEKRPLSTSAKRYESSDGLSDSVSSDVNGIGFVGLPSVRNAKVLMVGETGATPLIPSPFTVGTEDYPLTRRLYLYTPAASKNPWVREFVEFALSPEGQHIVERVGFVDLLPKRDASDGMATCVGCSPEHKATVAGAHRLSLNFRFRTSSTDLDNLGQRAIERVVTLMASSPNRGKSVLLLGFSDNKGDPDFNKGLSTRRAEEVERQLHARGLVSEVVKGFGVETPVASNDSDAGRDRNRRVEIWVR
jgi:phosphate transport system substrate-binding protein